MSKLLDKLKAPSLDNLSSHRLTGTETLFDRYLAKSFADCADGPLEPSILMGFPIMIPLMLFSTIISAKCTCAIDAAAIGLLNFLILLKFSSPNSSLIASLARYRS